jgi:TolB-like protein/Flp pilus assembly protein TadD
MIDSRARVPLPLGQVLFVFDNHVLDVDRRELRRGSEPVDLEPQVFDLLVYLVRHRERVISKDELIAGVWGGRIVSDSTLTSRINAARKAVGDSGEAQRLIRTYARKGVRFVGSLNDQSGPRAAGAAAVGNDAGASRTGSGKPCVAVLPFVNLSGDPEQDYFSDGITEDIITELSRNRALDVVARNSTFAFRGKAGDVREIGLELGAGYIVDGSVRRLGPNVRVTVQLAETEGGRQVWAERYDRALQDIFEVQDDITRKIAARIDPEIGIVEQRLVARKPPQAFNAWDFFRLGTKRFYSFTADNNDEAQRLLRRAIELDPDLAQAHGFLAYSIVLSMVYFDADADDARLGEAISIAKKGVELDDRDAQVRFMYGRALLARGLYGEALEELEAALDMNPSIAAVHCGLGDSLACMGRVPDAIPHFQSAIELSPHDPLRWAFLSYRALAHLFSRDFAEAERFARKATSLPNCHYLGYAHRVAALGHLPARDEREAAVAQLLRLKPTFDLGLARRRLFYVRDPDQLGLYLEGLRNAGIRADR